MVPTVEQEFVVPLEGVSRYETSRGGVVVANIAIVKHMAPVITRLEFIVLPLSIPARVTCQAFADPQIQSSRYIVRRGEEFFSA